MIRPPPRSTLFPTRRSSDLQTIYWVHPSRTYQQNNRSHECLLRALSGLHCRKSSPLGRSEEHTSELQSRGHLVCRLLLEKKKKNKQQLHRKQPKIHLPNTTQ